VSVVEHKRHAPRSTQVHWVTVSDTRTVETDSAGQAARGLVEAAGHTVGYSLLRDEPAEVAALVGKLASDGITEVVITSGGTGISRRDTTYEAIAGLLEKELPGFGELFRMLSYAEIGPAAMLSRATAGIYRGLVVFATPGSTAAVRLALEKLILPELGHLVAEVRK